MHPRRILGVLMLAYLAASLVHFVHNAEFIADYPNLPSSWTRGQVYLAWIAMTAIGATGWLLLARRYERTGLVLLAVYAGLGLDSLGHYVLAPPSSHTPAMNATILLEVTAAALVAIEVMRQLVLRLRPHAATGERP